MAISEVEFQKEKKILKKVQKLLGETLESLGQDVFQSEEDLVEFKKMMWENSNSFDDGENLQVMAATSLEADKVFQKHKYFKKLKSIRKKPTIISRICVTIPLLHSMINNCKYSGELGSFNLFFLNPPIPPNSQTLSFQVLI